MFLKKGICFGAWELPERLGGRLKGRGFQESKVCMWRVMLFLTCKLQQRGLVIRWLLGALRNLFHHTMSDISMSRKYVMALEVHVLCRCGMHEMQ